MFNPLYVEYKSALTISKGNLLINLIAKLDFPEAVGPMRIKTLFI
jgi:hypothetical protein